jgi:hypothetical protein
MNKLFYVFAFLTLNLSAVELADVSVAEEPLMKKLSFQTAQKVNLLNCWMVTY